MGDVAYAIEEKRKWDFALFSYEPEKFVEEIEKLTMLIVLGPGELFW